MAVGVDGMPQLQRFDITPRTEPRLVFRDITLLDSGDHSVRAWFFFCCFTFACSAYRYVIWFRYLFCSRRATRLWPGGPRLRCPGSTTGPHCARYYTVIGQIYCRMYVKTRIGHFLWQGMVILRNEMLLYYWTAPVHLYISNFSYICISPTCIACSNRIRFCSRISNRTVRLYFFYRSPTWYLNFYILVLFPIWCCFIVFIRLPLSIACSTHSVFVPALIFSL